MSAFRDDVREPADVLVAEISNFVIFCVRNNRLTSRTPSPLSVSDHVTTGAPSFISIFAVNVDCAFVGSAPAT